MSAMPTPSASRSDHAALGGTAATASPQGRASWSGLLRLSLVTVPVKAYPAITTTTETQCHQLHADCGQRIRYIKQCPLHGPVEAGAIVSGYPYAPDQHVVIDDDQLDQLRAPADRGLCLEHFIDADEFEPALFAGRSLYLMPDGMVANYPYAVLSAALRERKKWAIGRVVLSGQRRLVLVRPGVTTLSMHVLHYPAQVRPAAALGSVPAISDAEKDLAGQLIDAQSQPVNWSEYRDDRAEQLAVLVQAAIEQRPPTPAPAAVSPMLPLLEALRKSVAAIPTAASLPRINGATHPRQRTGKRSPVRRRA